MPRKLLNKTMESSEVSESIEDIDQGFFDCLVIRVDNPVKQYFDVIVLLLVGYSCIMTMYAAAFIQPTLKSILVLNWIVEGFFYTDLVLSFF